MLTFAKKTKATEQTMSAKSTKHSRSFVGQSSDVHSILHLQRTIGNQAVLRSLKTATENGNESSASSASTGFTHEFSQIPLYYAKTPTKSQSNITVSTPGDRYEQEADQVAEQVMRMKNPAELGRQDAARHTSSSISYDTDINSVSNAKALSPELRQFFEPRFGHNFARVRVHTDHAANESASHLHARAYTIGNDITFAAGEYRPGTEEGKRLIAHELAHVVQQTQIAGYAKPNSIASSVSRTPRRLIQRTSVAFYTLGDTRLLNQCSTLTRTDVSRVYAQQRSSQVYGVQTDAEALRVLNNLQPQTITSVLFVGHASQTGFFFSGRPDPSHDFVAPAGSVFDSNDTALISALIQALAFSGNESIEFHACNIGSGPLVSTLQSWIWQNRAGQPVNILAFSGTYRIRPIVQNCQIVNFAPPQMTIYPAGRLPSPSPRPRP